MKGRKNVNKTAKHCSVCQENFGDRFSFCPVCGSQLTSVAENVDEIIVAAPRELPNNQATTATAANYAAAPRENAAVKEVVSAPQFEANGTNHANGNGSNGGAIPPRKIVEKGSYNPTMLQTPKNYQQILLAGALAGLLLMMVGATTIYLYELFYLPLDVAAVDVNGDVLPVFGDDETPFKEEKEIERKDTRKGGGGGGGGGNESKPASKGGNPAMAPEPPVFTPNVNRPQVDNPSLPMQSTIQAPIRKAADEGPVGIKNSTSYDPSNGPGSGGGIGTGSGGGVGGGRGTGIGNGIGSGIGNGVGDGIGNNTGSGSSGDIPDFKVVAKKVDPPKPKVTEAYKILSKPSPGYTEEARKLNISGVVRVKVTLSASGQVTNIAPVKGLGGGLTEMAIAAARRIQFTPAKVDGVPISKTLTVEYNFTMY